MITIQTYQPRFHQQVIDLILPIQQNEFFVPIKLNDQPDLLNIPEFYCKNAGNFWVAVENEQLAGTVALIDFGNGRAALRKMFVRKESIGKEKGVAQLLLNALLEWCRKKVVIEIYLGTIDSMLAAHRFYEKNGFIEIDKALLPETFPLMKVDNKFFKLVV